MRAFVDANILFSAAARTSVTRRIFNAARDAGITLVTNAHAWEEAHRNLLQKRPEHAAGMDDLLKHVELSQLFQAVGETDLPPQDIPILAGALGSGCTHIWTSDKQHFGRWYGKKIHGITVVSSRLIADVLIEKGWNP